MFQSTLTKFKEKKQMKITFNDEKAELYEFNALSKELFYKTLSFFIRVKKREERLRSEK